MKRQRECSESVDDKLRRGIREGKYIPGQRLVEIDLRQELNASQRQVREALLRLEKEGLVSIKKNRGASVRKITRREVENILDVLDALSLLAVRRACENIDNLHSRKLIKNSLKLTRQFHRESGKVRFVQNYIDENVRSWDSIATVVDNPMLWDIRERLETMMYRLQVQGLTLNSDPEKWIVHHEEILSAILEEDVEAAERLVLDSSSAIREAIVGLAKEAFS
jgi:DNA-binding GntR family transcriptional regulator